jgi:hypothetical protein
MRSIDSGEWVEGIKETGRVLCEVFSIDLIFPHSPLFNKAFCLQT